MIGGTAMRAALHAAFPRRIAALAGLALSRLALAVALPALTFALAASSSATFAKQGEVVEATSDSVIA